MPKAKLPPKNFEWTPNLAYVVGLLVTDGSLSNDGRHIVMRSSEPEQLRTFAQCLGLKNKVGVTDNQRGYRVQFGNIQFYNWLMRIGLFSAKTYTIGTIDVPNRYFRDFLRGHLDGDGNIQGYTDHHNAYRGRTYANQRIFVRFISASENHIRWLREKIQGLVGVNGALIRNRPKNARSVSVWEIKFAKKESIKLLTWIYYDPDLPALQRKRLLAERLVSSALSQTRRPYTRIVT